MNKTIEAVGYITQHDLDHIKKYAGIHSTPISNVKYPPFNEPIYAAPPAPANEDGHIWHEKVFSSMKIKCCMNCGFIKNEDKPNKPCPGPIGVGLRESAPAPIPAGWKLVPVEPTQNMISAGISQRHDEPVPEAWKLATENIYRAMIEAAPEAP